jgi:hypothetical protein
MRNFDHEYFSLTDKIVSLSHAVLILFVIIGVLVIAFKFSTNNPLVQNRSLRLSHIIASAYISFTALIGLIWPVHKLEKYFSDAAGGAPYPHLIATQWLREFLGNPAPDWVFFLTFVVLTAILLLLFKACPPAINPDRDDSHFTA